MWVGQGGYLVTWYRNTNKQDLQIAIVRGLKVGHIAIKYDHDIIRLVI